jgi:hypothetical protein
VPTSGLRFGSRAVARTAARAAEQYRTALRRYDPAVPHYDLIACQDALGATGGSRSGAGGGAAEGAGFGAGCGSGSGGTAGDEPGRAADRGGLGSPPADGDRRLVEFCHGVAAATFEALSAAGHGDVETAVMDAYFDLAERVGDPDGLCLRLLESMAVELDARLAPTEQAALVARAADRLGDPADDDDPVTATFDRLSRLGLVGDYGRPRRSVDLDADTRSVVVGLSGYALSPQEDRLPVLPVVVELSRRRLDWSSPTLRAVETADGWRVALELAADGEPDGLLSAPIGHAGSER